MSPNLTQWVCLQWEAPKFPGFQEDWTFPEGPDSSGSLLASSSSISVLPQRNSQVLLCFCQRGGRASLQRAAAAVNAKHECIHQQLVLANTSTHEQAGREDLQRRAAGSAIGTESRGAFIVSAAVVKLTAHAEASSSQPDG